MGSSSSHCGDDFEFEDLFCGLVAMGHTSSSGNPTGKKVVGSKMDTASKTGVLSVADMVRFHVHASLLINFILLLNRMLIIIITKIIIIIIIIIIFYLLCISHKLFKIVNILIS